MNEIQNLIELTTHELENINTVAAAVGNRPNYPMLIMSNNLLDEEMYNTMYRKIKRNWPQTASKLLFASYKQNGSSYILQEKTGNALSEDEVKIKLDEIKMTQNTFADMKVLNIYNIIDTSVLNSLEEFEAMYLSCGYFQNMVIGSKKSLAIVLLDDSTVKHELANKIRCYVADHDKAYDGVVVVSNRTFGDVIYPMHDLYKITANVIILSNNNAISAHDDADYSARVSCLYNNHMNTVSYSLFERPNKDIAIQLIDTFLREAEKCVENTRVNSDIQSWKKRLGISNKIDICEEFLKGIDYQFELEALEHIPFKNGDDILKLNLQEIAYGQFKAYTYPNVLEQFINNYYNEILLKSIDINSCFARYEKSLKANIDAWSIDELDDMIVDNIFAGLKIGGISESLKLSTYIRELMYNSIRENVIYPKCKEIIKKVKREAEATRSAFYKFRNEFIENKPIDEFAKIGTMYQTFAELYLKMEQGNSDIKELLASGNIEKDFSDILLKMVKNTIANNKSSFMMPFIDEWAQRLGLAGDVIYKKIHQMLDENVKDKIHLAGLYPIENKMQVYILHTSDTHGQSKTELYNHLSSAYQDVPGVQFFNTGFDDSLEVMKFYDCSGDKIKVMGV